MHTLPADQTVVVRRRFGDEKTDVRHFIRPDDIMVLDLVRGSHWTLDELWGWVLTHIQYPPGGPMTLDLHVLDAFGEPFQRTYSTNDFWNFPAETLRDMIGDCEDSTFLLTSMIRAALPHQEVYASVGFFDDFGHTWVSIPAGNGDFRILDTTLSQLPDRAPLESEPTPYMPIMRFNDHRVIIVEDELFVPDVHTCPAKNIALATWYAIEGIRGNL